MKKIVVAIFASLALTLGSGALVSSASAAPTTEAAARSYPGTVPTTCNAKPKTVKTGRPFRFTISVSAGNARVKGTVTITFAGNKYTAKVVNGAARFTLKAPRRASTQKLSYAYKPPKGSVFKASKGSVRVKLKR